MSAHFRLALCATVAITGLFSTHITWAQGSDQPTAQSPAASADVREEIVVTTNARRREEKIQSVPIAITAFSGTELEKHSIGNITDLQHEVPSLTYSPTQRSGIGSEPLIRGLPGVLTYFSEVPLILDNQIGDSLNIDLSDVQVLKGPQGTLFGQNTTGGAILFTPKHPTNDYEGYVQVLFGEDNWKRFQGAVNIPIVPDKLLIRIAGQHEERDGFTTVADTRFAGRFKGLDLDNKDSWYGRVGITFRPTDDIENYTMLDTTDIHTNGTALVLNQLNPDPNFAPNSINYLQNQVPPYGAAPASPFYFLKLQQKLGVRQIIGFDPVEVLDGTRVTFNFAGPIEKARNYDIIDILKWNITDDLELKNIAGYVSSHQLTRSDFTDTPIVTQGFVSPRGWNNASVGAGGGRGVATQYTEELQLNGNAVGGNLKYTIGGYLRYFTSGPQDGQITTGSSALFSQLLVSAGGGGTARTQAAYVEETYDVGSLWDALDGLKFTGGFRYNFDYASETQHIKVVKAAGLGPFPLCVGGNNPKEPSCNQFASGHFQSPGWNLTLDYHLDPETLLYVRSGKAYRPGGFTPSAAKPGDRSYQPENLVDVEVGAKADWELFGMRARTNVDAYHAFYSDIQVGVVSFVLVDGSETNLGTTENAAQATSEGFEWDGSLFPTKDLELKVNGSFNHNVFDKFNSAFFGQLKGRSFAGFPKFKIDLGFTYHLPIDEAAGDVALTADWSYQTHYFLAVDNGPSASPTHRLINWRIDWNNIYGEPVDLGFFMTNATDATFVVGAFGLYNQQGFTSFVYNEPREFGMELKYRFDEPAPEPETTPAPYVPPPVQAVAPRSYLVFFDFNKSDLTAQAQQIVDQAASNAGPAKVTRLTVTGHTDTVGSDAYNMRLSRRRAESVAARLEKDGIPSSEIEIVAKGKRDLLVPTADGVREPQNRRVQIVYDDGVGA